MKKITFAILSAAALFAAAEVRASDAPEDITGAFLKPSDLPGGSSAWIAAGVKEEKQGRCTVYTDSYTYYSKTGETFWGMERKNTYSVGARIFACDNFISAAEKYDELVKTGEKLDKPKHLSPVAFGEKGVMMALPRDDKSRSADFYLTFLMRTFVVQVYSDDGFAQMDVAGEMERRLRLYSLSRGSSYFINKINLSINAGEAGSGTDTVTFTGDNVSVVTIGGTVFDSSDRPVPGAEITVRETGQKAVTDSSGRYSLEINAGDGQAVSLQKILFVDGKVSGAAGPFSSGIYPLYVMTDKKSETKWILNVLVTGGKIIGAASVPDGSADYPVEGSVEGESVNFMMNCSSPGSAFVCSRRFSGVSSGDRITGDWKGTGGKGSWSVNKAKYSVVSETGYAADLGFALSAASESGGTLRKASGSPVSSSGKPRGFARIDFDGRNVPNKLFFRNAVVRLKVKDAKISAPAELVFYSLSGEGAAREVESLKISPGFSGEVSFDVSAALRSSAKASYLVGLKGAEGDFAVFEQDPAAEAFYYKDADNYKAVRAVAARVVSFSSVDKTSNSNAAKPDGEADVAVAVTLNVPGGLLEYAEIESRGETVRRWNTNPFDVYPAIAVYSGDTLLNDSDGSVKIRLKNAAEKLEFYIFKGSLTEETAFPMILKIVADGRNYETEIKNIKEAR